MLRKTVNAVAWICIVNLVVVLGMPYFVAFLKPADEINNFVEFLDSCKMPDVGDLSFISSYNQSYNPRANPEENSGKFEGDILLDDWMINEMVQQYSQSEGTDILWVFPDALWPDSTVIWQFGDELNLQHRLAIREAISDIEQHTCIKFRQREPDDVVYVLITGSPGGCYANLGYWRPRGVHRLNIQLQSPGYGCFRHTTIVHEWFHILGLLHMHSVDNRDDYIVINEDNVLPGMQYNFYLVSVDRTNVTYDYTSILHYGPYAFTENDKPTVVASQSHIGAMGQREYVTDYDWLRVNRMYKCPGTS